MTTGISLVRENAESMQPPRSLWVEFPLGRPLGKPNDAAFQLAVVRAALELLERPAGPVLEDYPVGVGRVDPASAPACPVSFQRSEGDAGNWRSSLGAELAELSPWYALSQRRRQGRTLVGVAGQTPEVLMGQLAELLDDARLPTEDPAAFKAAIEDLKAFYLEAMSAQPGEYDAEQLRRTLWQETNFGAALIALHDQFVATESQGGSIMARLIAPRDAIDEARSRRTTAAQLTATDTRKEGA